MIRERTMIPTQGIRFTAMPLRRPARSATIPTNQGKSIPPTPAKARRMPTLAELSISPMLATPMG